MMAALPASVRYESSRPRRDLLIFPGLMLLMAAWAAGWIPSWFVAEMLVLSCVDLGYGGVERDDYLRSRPIDRGAELRAKLASVALRGALLGAGIAIWRAADTWTSPVAPGLGLALVRGISAGAASLMVVMLVALARAAYIMDRLVPFGLDRGAPELAGLRDLVALGVFVAGSVWFQVQDFEDPLAAWSALALGLMAGGFVLAGWYAPTRVAWIGHDWAPDVAADADAPS